MGDLGVSRVYWRGPRCFERGDSPLLRWQLTGLALLPLRGISTKDRIGEEARDIAIGCVAIPLATLGPTFLVSSRIRRS